MTTVKIHGQKVPRELKEMNIVPTCEESIASLLERVVGLHPELQEILLSGTSPRSDMGILINGRHCMFMDGLKTRVMADDLVDIIMPVIGG